jgi:hypothetical protein
MALLTITAGGEPGWHDRPGRRLAAALVWLLCCGPAVSAPAEPSREYGIKAVFLFNFARFVAWPPVAFADAQAPLVIGVLGDDPFGDTLDEAARAENVNGHPLVVRRFHAVEDVGACQILFISRSEAGRLGGILAALKGRSLLTVGDMDDFARRGGMIRFITENNRVRLRINLEAAQAAHLTLSSKLLRPAEIVGPGKG